MKTTAVTEVRIVKAVKVSTAQHFFFSGPALMGQSRTSSRHLSGELVGVVKVTRLHNGNFSLRSLATLGGDGRLVHVKSGTKVVIDGRQFTIEAFFHMFS